MPPGFSNDYFLISQSISRSTRKYYHRALKKFLSWTTTSSDSLRRLSDASQLDALLVEYFHHLFRNGNSRGNRQQAVNTSCAIRLVLGLQSASFPHSTRALVGWDKLQPVNQTAPMPYGICLVLAERFLLRRDRQMALITLIGFLGILRISEVLSLRWCDVSWPTIVAPGMLRLPKTKTGLNQSVMVKEHFVWTLLTRWLTETKDSPKCSKSSGQKIFRISTTTYRAGLSSLQKSMSLPVILTPHSLRAGGATRLHIDGESVETIAQRGRWRSLVTLRRYLQEGRSLQLTLSMPDEVCQKASALTTQPQNILMVL